MVRNFQEEGTGFTKAGAEKENAFEELRDDQGCWKQECRMGEEDRNLRMGLLGDEAWGQIGVCHEGQGGKLGPMSQG